MTPSPPPPPPQEWPRITTPPRLLASTGAAFCGSISSTSPNTSLHRAPQAAESNVFKSLQWTPDGTTVLTHSEDDGLRTFVLPPDLLSSEKSLTPYTTTFTSSRVYSTAIYPLASLSAPETFVYLCSPRSAPIRLHSLLYPGLISSYPLVNPHTETHDAPYSLLIPPHNPHTFLAGTKSQISIFDLHRSGDGPMTTLKTIPTRRTPATTITMKGLVTALALGSDGVLAAGTNTRQVGLYAGDGGGEVVGVFALEDGEGAGAGVMQLLWSACGRYLYIAERKSNEVSVYDIRVSGLRVESFRGRRAETNQRIGVTVASGLGGEVVGGGVDGVVRIWEAGHGQEGKDPGECVGSWQAHEDVVTSAAVHPTGSVLATCSGSRKTFGLRSINSSDDNSSSSDGESGEDAWDNSFKIWEIPATPSILEP